MANLELWRNNFSPLRDMATFSKAFDRMLEDWPMPRTELSKYNFNPNCEVKETKSNFLLKMDLPGVPKEAIKIDLQDDRLTISGERSEEKKSEDKEGKLHFSEMYYGSFTRSMTFPASVESEKAEAKYDNGVLTLTIPKKASHNTRQISIK